MATLNDMRRAQALGVAYADVRRKTKYVRSDVLTGSYRPTRYSQEAESLETAKMAANDGKPPGVGGGEAAAGLQKIGLGRIPGIIHELRQKTDPGRFPAVADIIDRTVSGGSPWYKEVKETGSSLIDMPPEGGPGVGLKPGAPTPPSPVQKKLEPEEPEEPEEPKEAEWYRRIREKFAETTIKTAPIQGDQPKMIRPMPKEESEGIRGVGPEEAPPLLTPKREFTKAEIIDTPPYLFYSLTRPEKDIWIREAKLEDVEKWLLTADREDVGQWLREAKQEDVLALPKDIMRAIGADPEGRELLNQRLRRASSEMKEDQPMSTTKAEKEEQPEPEYDKAAELEELNRRAYTLDRLQNKELEDNTMYRLRGELRKVHTYATIEEPMLELGANSSYAKEGYKTFRDVLRYKVDYPALDNALTEFKTAKGVFENQTGGHTSSVNMLYEKQLADTLKKLGPFTGYEFLKRLVDAHAMNDKKNLGETRKALLGRLKQTYMFLAGADELDLPDKSAAHLDISDKEIFTESGKAPDINTYTQAGARKLYNATKKAKKAAAKAAQAQSLTTVGTPSQEPAVKSKKKKGKQAK